MDNSNELLQKYLKDYWEFVLKNNPTFATYIGDHRYNDALEDLSEESVTAQVDFCKDMLAKTEMINQTDLTGENALNLKLFRKTNQNHIQMHDLKSHFLPLNQMYGPHLDFPQIIEFHPFHEVKDIENYVTRLNSYPKLIDQVIVLFERGIEHKHTAFKRVMELTMNQVESFSKLTAESHPLLTPAMSLSEEFTQTEKENYQKVIKESISSRVTPSYEKLFEYLSKKYLEKCRDKEGIWALPNGMDMYRFYAQYHTTTDLSPEEIHEIGKHEVERIEHEIKKIMQEIQFDGSIRELTEHLKNKADLYPKTRAEIIYDYRNILSHMDERLSEYFGRLPKARYDIKEIEEYREQAAPAAYYYPPPKDFSRPGYFYANTYKPETRPKFIMEALAYHEAVPGHHLQIAIMQEQEDLPDFRRHEGSTAFIEGWALYAEKLSKEMGFYKDVLSEYGRLNFEIWRAVRLVVDTGIHYYKWSRDDAINYCKENSGEDDHEIEVEVDRYIAMPGQALAYKIGELKILELREKAKKMRGDKFGIRDFHDRLLENGALPLYALDDLLLRE